MKDQPRDTDRNGPSLTGKTKARKHERQGRLGDALRLNLQKRKQQQRQQRRTEEPER